MENEDMAALGYVKAEEAEEMKKYLQVVHDFDAGVRRDKREEVLKKDDGAQQFDLMVGNMVEDLQKWVEEMSQEFSGKAEKLMTGYFNQIHAYIEITERQKREIADLKKEKAALSRELEEVRANLKAVEHEQEIQKLRAKVDAQAGLADTVEKLAAEVAALRGGAPATESAEGRGSKVETAPEGTPEILTAAESAEVLSAEGVPGFVKSSAEQIADAMETTGTLPAAGSVTVPGTPVVTYRNIEEFLASVRKTTPTA